MLRLSGTGLIILAVVKPCSAQRERLEVQKPATLRLIVTIEGDIDKAVSASVELMDAIGFGSAMDNKVTDNDGSATFRTFTGVHRIRITGPNIQPYEGELEITRNETSHMERIRVHRAMAKQSSFEVPPGALVATVRLRIPTEARKAFESATEAMSQQLWQKSRELFETAIRDYPQYDMAYNGLGLVQLQLNDVEGARQSFAKAVLLNPDYAGANRNLARILMGEHKNSEALPLLKKSLAAEPENVWALTNAANSELLLRDYSDAILHARKAHSVPHEAFPVVHIIAARALEATKQPAEARAEYQLYLKEDPKGRDAERARQAIGRLSTAAPSNTSPH